MRVRGLFFILAAGLAITSCNREQPAARQVGHDAYRASEELKQGARKAGRELRNAGKEIREGWNEAKHEDPPPKQKPLTRDNHR